MAHFAFSMQNCIYYFRWTAGLIAVTKSLWGGTINVKYGTFGGRQYVKYDIYPQPMRPCVRTFDRHRGARERSTHIVAKLH